MSLEFARSLADVRLLQTARLLEWMLDNDAADVDVLGSALGAVREAHGSIRSLGAEAATA